jgi:hypothetical protein
MGDPKIYRRQTKATSAASSDSGAVYDNDGNLMQNHHHHQQMRRNLNGPGGAFGGGANNNPGWNGARSPALAANNGRFGDGADGGGLSVPNGFGLGMGMPSPGLGLPGMPGLGAMGMGQLSPFMMNMAAMGMTPEAQLLAAQMAGFAPNNWMNMAGGLSAGMAGMGGSAGIGGGNRSSSRGPGSARSVGGKSSAGTSTGSKKDEEDFDPQILNDVPAWLRSLRLHKYTPNFEGMKWQEMAVLDEPALEKLGVAALGARRKMLKTFEIVKKKMGMGTTTETPMPSAAATSASTTSSGRNSATTTANHATAVEASAWKGKYIYINGDIPPPTSSVLLSFLLFVILPILMQDVFFVIPLFFFFSLRYAVHVCVHVYFVDLAYQVLGIMRNFERKIQRGNQRSIVIVIVAVAVAVVTYTDNLACLRTSKGNYGQLWSYHDYSNCSLRASNGGWSTAYMSKRAFPGF